MNTKSYAIVIAISLLICGNNAYANLSPGIHSVSACGGNPTCQICKSCRVNSQNQPQFFGCIPDPSCASPSGSTGTTPPPPTTSSTSTPISKGTPLSSSAIRPPSGANVLYSSETTNSTAIAYFGYTTDTSLPPCPYNPGSLSNSALSPSVSTLASTTSSSSTSGSTTNMTTTQYLTATQILPDINNNNPAGSTPPPDQCVARSLILCTTPTGTAPCTDYSQPIVTAINAVCPDGYAQVGAFDYEPNVIYVSSPPAKVSSPSDITNMNDYQFYTAQGFGSCDTISGTPFYTSVCLSPYNNNGGQLGSFVYTFNEAFSSPYPNEFHNTYYPIASSPGPGVVFFKGPINNGSFYANQNGCDNNLGTSVSVTDPANDPNVTWQISPDSSNFPGNTRIAVNFKVNGSLLLNFYYGHITCTKTSGSSNYYFTTNRSPRALICVKIQPIYRPVNK